MNLLSSTFKVKLLATSGAGNLLTVTVTFMEFERYLSVSPMLTVMFTLPPIKPDTLLPNTVAMVVFWERYSNTPSLLVVALISTLPPTSTIKLVFSTVKMDVNLLTVTVMLVSFARYLSFPSNIRVMLTLPPLRPVTLPVVAFKRTTVSSLHMKRKY